MLKKIKTRELKIGMYAVFPPSSWLRHSFLGNSFTIHSEGDLNKLNESCFEHFLPEVFKQFVLLFT